MTSCFNASNQFCNALREPIVRLPAGVHHIDLIDGGSEEDIITDLRYYADADERRAWAEEYPGIPIPRREDPPFDRDRRLPSAAASRIT